MGEHGLAGKTCIYEGVFRIPFLVRYPEKVTPGLVVDHHVSTVDFMSTMMGEVVAMGASLSLEHDCTPRTVRQKHLQKLSHLAEIGIPWVPKG